MTDLYCLNVQKLGRTPINLECQLVIILKEQKAENHHGGGKQQVPPIKKPNVSRPVGGVEVGWRV